MEAPAIGAVQGKVWGVTRQVFLYNGTSAHLLHIVRGGYCSKHIHAYKHNRFVVVSGQLKILIWRDEHTVDSSIIRCGEVSDVPPGVRHQFEALEDTVALEFYWAECDENDIDRGGTIGGVHGSP